MTTEVVLISATWCARCKLIKPDVEVVCRNVDAIFSIVDYDDLEEDDPVKKSVVALPTIRMRRGDGEWTSYKPSELETWRASMLEGAVKTTGEDF